MLLIRNKASGETLINASSTATNITSSLTILTGPQSKVERFYEIEDLENTSEAEQSTLLVSTQVLRTIELLTPVLEYCDPHTLLCYAQRVNRTWKGIIDGSKYIQQCLFFAPWGEDEYLGLWGEVNPFINLLECTNNEENKPERIFDFGSDDEEPPPDEGLALHPVNDDIILHMFDWNRLGQESKFMREGATWRRMLPIQPPTWEVWNTYRPEGELLEGQHQRMRRWKNENGTCQGKRLGETYDHVLDLESDPCCLGTRTFIRYSQVSGVIVQINIRTAAIDAEKDLRNLNQTGWFCR